MKSGKRDFCIEILNATKTLNAIKILNAIEILNTSTLALAPQRATISLRRNLQHLGPITPKGQGKVCAVLGWGGRWLKSGKRVFGMKIP